MSKKTLKNDGILFCGNNATDVTGSCIYIKYNGKNILLECGMVQNNDYLESYKANTEKFAFDPRDIDYVFIGHSHFDHVGALPRLVKEGFCGKIICSHATAVIMKELLLNSCFILKSEVMALSSRYKRNYPPIYEEEDVHKTMEYVYEYDNVHQKYILDDVISFEWLENSHCVGARQLRLSLKDINGVTKHILYTSDIGALHTKNHYVPDTEIDTRHNEIVIMESTYGVTRESKKTREFDLEHLRVAIETVIERKGTCVLPCFSFARTQELLTNLYKIYENVEMNFPIIVDSMLSVDICNKYSEILDGEDKELWSKVRNWDAVKYITDKNESLACVKSHTPKVVLSSSGFCTNGRVLSYLHEYLSDENSMVIFSGYAGSDNSYLSYRIQHYKENKKITISGDPVPNKADCITMTTFSSHASHKDLVEFGSSQNTNRLVLVHGSEEAKNNLKHELKEAISKKDKSFKVVCAEKDMAINL